MHFSLFAHSTNNVETMNTHKKTHLLKPSMWMNVMHTTLSNPDHLCIRAYSIRVVQKKNHFYRILFHVRTIRDFVVKKRV